MDSIDLVSKQHIYEPTNDSNCVTALMISAINPNTTTATCKWSEEQPRRRLLESEDSSYDSDYENNDFEHCIIKKLPSLPINQHEEVVRTISDTLGAEFDEYVTASPLPRQTLLDVIINDPNYTSRVEFGLKLGYTETQVQIALMKLGPQALQNELLGELIKLGASGNCGINSANCNNTVKTNVASFINDIPNGDDTTGDNSDSANLRPIVIDGSNVAIRYDLINTRHTIFLRVI
jgi:ribonuclease ZC3H12